jgi:DNA helicase II / ATP-dependent DNA helicase PcrA
MSEVAYINPDIEADEIIAECATLEAPKSFFLFAGAGSGKTGSLVTVLKGIQENQRDVLLRRGQRVAVITYTNAASEVIAQRLKFDPLIHVSTIHSFAWSLISGYHADIRRWLRKNLQKQIQELEEILSKTRTGTKVRVERESSLVEKQERLRSLDRIRTFTYSPTGENSSRDSLSHYEVIEICASFLLTKAIQSILIGRFPFLFIDESQDTNKALIESLFVVEAAHRGKFCLGLFGDMMQRIYADGKVGLDSAVPEWWAKPEKKMNWRCPKRVVSLINEVRKPVDGLQQLPDPRKPEGFVRCFIFPATVSNKEQIEADVARKMAEVTGDADWNHIERRKTLTLEHHMAAKRLGFADFFMPLYQVKDFRTGLLEGTLSGIPLFISAIVPLVKAVAAEDKFEIAKVIRTRSPLLKRQTLAVTEDKAALLARARAAVAELSDLSKRAELTAGDPLRIVAAHGLFEIPENLRATLRAEKEGLAAAEDDPEVTTEGAVQGWYEALQAPFQQVELVANYLTESASFDTHQGVKGREFPRVMVIMDDEDARGFSFSFDKLFEVSPENRKNDGEERSSDRTRRLFYVTCSRAENSLALVIYTADPARARQFFRGRGWFSDSEIESVA